MLARTLRLRAHHRSRSAYFELLPEPPKEKLSELLEEFIYTSLANSPVTATQVGYHRHGEHRTRFAAR